MPALVLWHFAADWELVEVPVDDARVPAASHGWYVEVLGELVAHSATNRALLRRFVEHRFVVQRGDDAAAIDIVADALVRGVFELRETPRPDRGSWANRPSVFDGPLVPLRTLIRDPVPHEEDTSFVAFIVVDQDFRPLAGRFTCTIDGDDRKGELPGEVVRYEPIRPVARIDVRFTDVRARDEEAGDG